MVLFLPTPRMIRRTAVLCILPCSVSWSRSQRRLSTEFLCSRLNEPRILMTQFYPWKPKFNSDVHACKNLSNFSVPLANSRILVAERAPNRN